MKRLGSAVLLGMCICLCLVLPRARAAAPPPVQASPVPVQVGVYVLNVGNLDTRTGQYVLDFYLNLQCQDACEPDGFEFMNGRAVSLKKQNDTPTLKVYRIQASLSDNLTFHDYPFDRPRMSISIEDEMRSIDSLVYVVDRKMSGIDPAVTVSGWEIVGWDAVVEEHDYPVFDQTYSRYSFHIVLARPLLASIMKVLIPAIFIVLGAFFAMFLRPDKAVNRLTILTSGLVGAILFHLNTFSSIPPVGYLTYADRFMIANYLIMVLGLGVTIYLDALLDKKRDVAALKGYHISRIGLPVLWLVLQAVNSLWLLR